jgi:farnesyl diphosphate synthase
VNAPPEKSAATGRLAELLGGAAEQVQADLDARMIEPGTPEPLAEAMRYAAGGGGKRLRPALVMLAAEAVGAEPGDENVRRAAMAVEMVHCYSLVHDDLPAMDDDDLRRGRPTVHVRFGEAMAILVGDALLTRALGLLAETDPAIAPALLGELAGAAGPAGMIAGQVADMGLCPLPEGVEGVEYVQARKTAALIAAAAGLGAICARAGDVQYKALTRYAHQLGMVFQVVDDLLDVTASAEQVGKHVGKDAQAGKRTHLTLLGEDQARRLARQWTDRAISHLAPLGPAGGRLEELARLLTSRSR